MNAPSSALRRRDPLRVLLVEDALVHQKLATNLLQRQGHSVTVSTNGKEAVDLLESQPFDLVLMDVEMPVMDGIQATAQIKSNPATKHIPVLIFTSLGGENDLRRAREAGCQGFLNKPISREAIQAEIAQLLDGPGQH